MATNLYAQNDHADDTIELKELRINDASATTAPQQPNNIRTRNSEEITLVDLSERGAFCQPAEKTKSKHAKRRECQIAAFITVCVMMGLALFISWITFIVMKYHSCSRDPSPARNWDDCFWQPWYDFWDSAVGILGWGLVVLGCGLVVGAISRFFVWCVGRCLFGEDLEDMLRHKKAENSTVPAAHSEV